MKKKLAQGIVSARYVLLVLMLACAALCATTIRKTNINYDLTRYLANDTMTRRALAVMKEEFGSGEQLRVMFADQAPEALNGYIAALNNKPEVLLASHDPETGAVQEDGKTWQLVTVSLNDTDAQQAVREIREMFPEAGVYAVGGSAADHLDIQMRVGKEIPEVMLIAVAVVLVMLLVTSRAWMEPVVILIVLAVSIVINMGTNFIFADVSFITFAVSAILQLALSIDYAIMLLHTFNRCRDQGMEAKEAMTEALAECFMRITSSAMTTVVGLLSLLFMSFTFGFDIGLVLSKGILCTLLGVFLLMPAVTLLLEKPLRLTRHQPLNLGGDHLANLIVRIRKPLAACMILLVLGGLYLNSQNVYSFSSAEEKSNNESAEITARFGISNPLVFLVPGGEEDSDYDLQRAFVAKLRAIRMENGDPAVSSVSAMVTTGEMALKYYTPQEVADLTGQSPSMVSLFFRMQGFGESVRADKLLDAAAPLAAGSEQIGEMRNLLETARSAFIGPTRHRILAEVNFTTGDPDFASCMQQILGAAGEVYGSDFYVTGVPMSNYDISNAFRGDLVRVNIITLLAILLIVTVSFRSVPLPLLLVFVIEGAIWITMGVSRLAGQPIFFISYLICLSIQMGATIDYAILLSDHYRSFRRSGLAPADALKQAMKNAMPTILTSGIILIVAGFIIGKRCSIYYISSIGLLVSRGALVSVLLVLSLLPALLVLFDRVLIRARKTTRSGITENDQS